MAGIGFELKRLFKHKGLILNTRAGLYASAVVAGPMILGAVLLLGIKSIAFYAGASSHEQDILVVIVTYSVLFPLVLTSSLTLVSTRYVADMIYEDQYDRILPSMYGVISICLPVGALFWAIFLIFCKLPLWYSVFSFMLFCEAIVVWVQITYTNSAKDYRSAVLGFAGGISIGFLAGAGFIWLLHLDIITSLLAAVSLAYGIMMISFTVVLHRYFPIGVGTSLKFLEWVEKYPSLIVVGFCMSAGLFVHMLIMWFSPWSANVIGLFRHAPPYDIPALLGMMTTLVTAVRFVTSVELAFFPKYRLYFGMLNGGSNLSDLAKASREMITVMKQELFYLAQIQMLVELILIALASSLLPRLGLGFTPSMIGLFRVLCVGFGLYAIGYSMVLFLLYLSDYHDAMIATITLFVVSLVGTIITLYFPSFYYGFGFVVANLFMLIQAWVRLARYIERLDYNVFSKQPVFLTKRVGWLTRMARKLDQENIRAGELS